MAQRIPQEVIEEVRHRTNIVDIIGQYVQLKNPVKLYGFMSVSRRTFPFIFSSRRQNKFFTVLAAGKVELFLISCKKLKALVFQNP